MFSPPPQPQIPLKMLILSQNAIFLTERVNFYPNNWKFTFLPKRGATKNYLGQKVGQLKIRFSEQIDTPVAVMLYLHRNLDHEDHGRKKGTEKVSIGGHSTICEREDVKY